MMELLTIKGISQALQVKVGTVYYWVSRNEIPYVRVGKHLRFNLSAVLRHFETKTQESLPPCQFSPSSVAQTVSRSLKSRNASHAGSPRKE